MKLVLLVFVVLSQIALAYDWKNKPDKFFYRVGEYASPKEEFLWMENKERSNLITFHADIMLKSDPVAELNGKGFSINGELKCQLFDNFNVKYGSGSEEDWFVDVKLEKQELEDLKKQFKKYRICDVPPLYNVIEKNDTYRYIAPAKLVDGQRSVFETRINGKKAYFKYKGGRILYSLQWRKERYKQCMERIMAPSSQKLIKDTLKCLKNKKDYMECGVSGYSRKQCTLEEFFGYPKGPGFTWDQDKDDIQKIKEAMANSVEDAQLVGNGEKFEIAKCELMDNGDAQIRFYDKKGGDDIWFWWRHRYASGDKSESMHLHFSACPE